MSTTELEPAVDPAQVPFVGLRRNARALAGAAVLLVALFLLPDLTPTLAQQPFVELARARIITVSPSSDGLRPDVRIIVVDGPRAGQEYDAFLQGPSGQLDVPSYAEGDEVVATFSQDPNGVFVAVSDRWRMPVLVALFGVFAAAVTLVGGWRGVRSILALTLTLAVVIKIVVPLVLGGWSPVGVAVLAASAVTVVTLLLTEGLRPTTLAAVIGTFCSLALTAAIAVAFTGLARFTQLQGSEDLVYLQGFVGPGLDLTGILLAAVIFGALGVLDDVTITQAATVHELVDAEPGAGRRSLFGRAMNVGRSHIAATVNTLVLAYVGASLPLLVLFAAGRQSPALIASTEVVAVEVVRSLAGSIGLVAAVPFTTAVAVLLVSRAARPSAWRAD